MAMTGEAMRGLRTFIVDLSMVVCLATVAAITIYTKSDADILGWLGAAYAGIATKSYMGKRQQGMQEIEVAKMEADK